MKILLFSDSHGYTHNMVKAISRHRDTGMVIHLGDFVKDAIKVAESYKDIKFEYVRGNNDWSSEHPAEKLLEIEGRRVLITHGHIYKVKYSYGNLIEKGASVAADAVFFGHTHLTEELFSGNMLVLNPGSISAPVEGNRPTYCIVDITADKIRTRFMSVG